MIGHYALATVLGATVGLVAVACGAPLFVACLIAAALALSVIWKADDA